MKRILINEEQEAFISKALHHEDALSKLPVHLLNDIRNEGTSLSLCDFFNRKIGKRFLETMSIERFDEIKNYFKDDISNITSKEVDNKLNKILSICQKKEKGIREQLEKICYDTIVELFDIPDESFDFECHLVDEIDKTKNFYVYAEPSNVIGAMNSDEIQNDDVEIQKRRIINNLCIGAAKRITDKARNIYLSKIFEIDEELPHLYSKFEKVNELSIFLNTIKVTDKNNQQGGYVEISLPTEDSIAKINANAVIFPILLNQCIQGLFELFSSFGLPSDKANKIMQISDALEYEPWDMRIGPALFDKVFKETIPEIDTKEIPYVFTNLVETDPNEFIKIIEESVEETEEAKQIMKQLYKKGIHDKDYSSFEDNIMSKQDDKTLVTDDLDENIETEAMYPQSFNMQEFKSLPSFSKRIRYCEQNLQRISSGSSRIVYKIDDSTVLKLAKNKKGVAQNEVEGQADYYRDSIDLFAKVYDIDENYLWIEMQLARKAKPTDFRRITGFDFKMIQEYLEYLRTNSWCQKYNDKYWDIFNSQEFQEQMYDEQNIFYQLEDYVKNYGLEQVVRDMQRISSWGIVLDENGQEKIVLIDYGLTPNVFNNYYKRY